MEDLRNPKDKFGNPIDVGDEIMYIVHKHYDICFCFGIIEEIEYNDHNLELPRFFVRKTYQLEPKWNTGPQNKRVVLQNPTIIKCGITIESKDLAQQ